MTGIDLTHRVRTRTRLIVGLISIVILMSVGTVTTLLHASSLRECACGVLVLVDEIDRVLYECRRLETDLQIDPSRLDVEELNLKVEELVSRTVLVQAQASDDSVRASLMNLASEEVKYGTVLRLLAANVTSGGNAEEYSRLATLVHDHADECYRLLGVARARLAALLAPNDTTERGIHIITIPLGLVLSLLIAGWLTRSIVGPIEYLRGVAEEVSVGDVQDIDIGFSEMDMARFSTPESLDLARSFRRMVSSLRSTVSSEVGLMDNYHMTIAVLVNRALGPAGRSIIEKARARAGFESFTEVRPGNVQRFLDALEEETRRLTTPEDFKLLADTIRNLRG